MTRKHILLLALASLFAFQVDSASACRVIRYSSSGEPLCAITSDGPGQSYRPAPQISFADQARQRARARAEEARRIAEMKRGGTMIGGILVSPYVAGSSKDRAWQAERRQRGFN